MSNGQTTGQEYIKRNPGDLVTAEDWNGVQIQIRGDIDKQVKTAINNIPSVKKADDAGTLAGKTADELTKEIIDKVLKEIPQRTGYMQLFKVLKVGEEKVIKHGLKANPVTDVYQLDYFEVVCAKGEAKEDQTPQWVNFYLYHTNEKKPRVAGRSIEIEPVDHQPFKILFKDMLERYHVKYTDTSSLDDLELEFWKAFFADPNDEFDTEQYCHSPWFEKCCGEQRTVTQLKQRGDWDDIWFKMEPRKTINYPIPVEAGLQPPAPTQVQMVHFDFDTLGIELLVAPIYPANLSNNGAPLINTKELKVMLLLKV